MDEVEKGQPSEGQTMSSLGDDAYDGGIEDEEEGCDVDDDLDRYIDDMVRYLFRSCSYLTTHT